MILRSRDALRRVESQFHKFGKKRMENFSQELSSSLPEEAEISPISQGSSNLVNSPDDHESEENHETSNSDQRNFSNKK